MRAPWLILGLLACSPSSGLRRGDLVPPVSGQPPRPDLYVQARQAGFALGGSGMFGWRSKGIGFTLDVHNRATAPVVLKFSRAVLHGSEIGGLAQFSSGPVINGAGPLPSKVEDRQYGGVDITLPPGQAATLWVLFGAREELDPWRTDDRRFRASLVIPTSSGSDVVVPIDDAREAPHLERWPLHTGVSFGASTSFFGSGRPPDGERQYVLSPFSWGIWHLRTPFLFRFSSAWTEVIETVNDRAAADSSIDLSLTSAWIPRGFWAGLDAGAGVMFLNGEQTSWGGRSPLFTASLGFVWAMGRAQGVPFTWRVGYLHNFSVPGDRHGTYFSLEVPVLLF
jgi:hypothetical protein